MNRLYSQSALVAGWESTHTKEAEMLYGRKRTVNLKDEAEELWVKQREVLEHASKVVQDASRQIQDYSRGELAPRVQGVFESGLHNVGRASSATRHAAGVARDRVVEDVLPAVTRALVSAATVLEVANSQKVRQALAASARIVPPLKKKTGPGVGTWILIGSGMVVAAGIALAAWQTLKSDQELFVSDDESQPLSTED